MSDLRKIDMKEKEAAEAIKIDGSLYQFLTEEIMDQYTLIIFKIGQLEGNYIEQFSMKAREKGITVNESLVKQLWKNGRPIPDVDLRSGEYGIEYAGIGFFHAGTQYYEKGNIKKALINLEKSLELIPRNILARALKMIIHRNRGEWWLTAAEAGNSILLNPVSIAEKDEASRAVLKEFGDGFADILEEILSHAYYTRGSAFFNLGLYKDALPDINETLKREPDLDVAIELRQVLNMKLELWDEALADGERLLAIGYKTAWTHEFQGIILNNMERYMEAIDEFTTAILLDPSLDYSYLQRSISNYEEGFMEAAVKDADEAIKRKLPDAHYYRAKGYAYTGEFEKAIADFDIALKETPDDESIKNYLEGIRVHKEERMGMMYVRQNERKEWEQVIRRDGKIESVILLTDFEDELKERRREEQEYWRLGDDR